VSIREKLAKRARKARLTLSSDAISGLIAYFELLKKWNHKVSLTSLPIVEDGEEALDRLLIEPALAAAFIPKPDAVVIDVGSGGGSPAIPMKLLAPAVSMRMIESKTRKAAFLREAIRHLTLTGTTVEAFRVEELLIRPELHEAAVAHREASAPIGALLSGGNDSSANVALLARAGRRPLHTFTCGLAEVEGQAHYSDLEYARQVAKLAGSVHHEALISANDFIATIPKTIDILDDLVSEPSSVFLYHALQMARNEGLKVVIAGEANDELTCGHREMINIRERYYQRWAPLMKAPRWARKSVAAAAAAVASKHQATLRRAAADDEYFWNFEIAWSDTEISDAVTQATQSQVSMTAPAETVRHVAERLRNSEHGQRDYMNYIVYAMMQDHYFGNLMMGKMDLIASNFGIEVRSPYTEPSYAHFVFNVPAQFKARPDVVKYFFKKAIEGLLPNEIIYRPKQGFRAPVVELFEGPLADWSRPVLLESGLTAAGYLNADHLRHLLEVHRTGKRDYSTRLWTVMVLNLWYERWIRQRSRN